MLNRPIDSYVVATSQKHFYILEYGGLLVQKTELSSLFYTNSNNQFVIY